jgi:NAD(P) transhydrogenase subunit beta
VSFAEGSLAAAAPTPVLVGFAYLVAGVCFILALRGLSSPVSSRRGNRFGMIGMVIAIATTLIIHSTASAVEIAGAIALGGVIGFVVARRIAMTDMPQLVAAFHSLVGLAAVLVALAAYLNPEAFGIADPIALDPVGRHLIHTQTRVEMGLGVAIRAGRSSCRHAMSSISASSPESSV